MWTRGEAHLCRRCNLGTELTASAVPLSCFIRCGGERDSVALLGGWGKKTCNVRSRGRPGGLWSQIQKTVKSRHKNQRTQLLQGQTRCHLRSHPLHEGMTVTTGYWEKIIPQREGVFVPCQRPVKTALWPLRVQRLRTGKPPDRHWLPGTSIFFFFWGGDLHFLTGNVEVTLAQLASYGPCFETDKRQEILLGKYECILIFQVYWDISDLQPCVSLSCGARPLFFKFHKHPQQLLNLNQVRGKKLPCAITSGLPPSAPSSPRLGI